MFNWREEESCQVILYAFQKNEVFKFINGIFWANSNIYIYIYISNFCKISSSQKNLINFLIFLSIIPTWSLMPDWAWKCWNSLIIPHIEEIIFARRASFLQHRRYSTEVCNSPGVRLCTWKVYVVITSVMVGRSVGRLKKSKKKKVKY